MDDVTNQVADDAATVDTDSLDATGVNDEAQLDEFGEPIEATEDEEEIELDKDLKLKLPKSQAEKLRQAAMRQDDYTRKTQDLAEQRKAFEAHRQATSEADEQELTARANIALIDRQLTQYQRVDWNSWNDSDPFEAQKAFQSYQLLKDAKTNAATFLEQHRTQRTEQQREETATKLQEAQSVLQRDIPEWSPTLAAKLVEFGSKEFGLSRADFDNVTDPRAVKLIHAAYQWQQHSAKTKTAQTIQKQQEVQPAASVGKAKAPPSGLDDRLSSDEWLRRRNAQLLKRG